MKVYDRRDIPKPKIIKQKKSYFLEILIIGLLILLFIVA
jgi:hypothetical protein